jgi:hypothetical protein
MQHPFPEKFIEQKLADTQREIEHIRLMRDAKGKNSPLQGWIANRMHNLSIWMICTGERLHERYHTTHIQYLHQRSTQAR